MIQTNERPILFSGPMVRAILEGRKTQTRRIVKPQGASMFPILEAGGAPRGDWFISYPEYERVGSSGHLCPYGQPGDRLWVRETWEDVGENFVWYRADHNDGYWRRRFEGLYEGRLRTINCPKWRPSIHMPRWASRITLEITDVRVERLREISEEDALLEGVVCEKCIKLGRGCDDHDLKFWFKNLWGKIHATDGPNGWNANPWVWVLTFKRIMP